MNRVVSQKGYTLIEMLSVLTLLAIAMGSSTPLSRRVISRYQLNTAAQMLVSDLSQAKIRAIQTNAMATVKRESDRDYRASGAPRRLPSMVRFDEAAIDSVTFNGLGAVSDGATVSFVLIDSYGETREVRVYAAGGHEVR